SFSRDWSSDVCSSDLGWFLTSATWYRLPGDITEGPGSPWYNKNTDLLLGADFKAAVRWTQRAVEQYRLTLEIPDAVAAVGPVIQIGRASCRERVERSG